MRVVIEFRCGNAIFEEDFEGEVRRLCHKAAETIITNVDHQAGDNLFYSGGWHKPLIESNGNTCGEVRGEMEI